MAEVRGPVQQGPVGLEYVCICYQKRNILGVSKEVRGAVFWVFETRLRAQILIGEIDWWTYVFSQLGSLNFPYIIGLQFGNVWNDVLVWTCLYFERYLNELEPTCMHLSTRLARTWPQSSEKTKSRRCRGDSRKGRTFNWIKLWLWWHVMTWGFSCLKSLRFRYVWPIGAFVCLVGLQGGDQNGCFETKYDVQGMLSMRLPLSEPTKDKRRRVEVHGSSDLQSKVQRLNGDHAQLVSNVTKQPIKHRLKIRLPFAFEANFGRSTGQSPSSIWKGISVGEERNLERCFGGWDL